MNATVAKPIVTTTPAAAPSPPVAASAGAPAPTRRSDALLPNRLAARLTNEWLPGIGWHASRTGRAGLAGIALLIAAGVFYGSTHRQVAAEADALRDELASARQQASESRSHPAVDPAAALRNLPRRVEMPAVLGVLLKQAEAAHLSLDTGKYELTATKTGEFVRYRLSFPVTGPYPQVRQFLDATLEALPSVAISELSFERKSIGDPNVEANIRLSVFTRAGA
jgi:hypothetical protein